MIKFLFFSIMGLFAFLSPFEVGGNSKILMGHVKDYVMEKIPEGVTITLIAFSIITIVGTVIGLLKRNFNNKRLNDLFITSFLNSILRIGGGIIFLLIALKKAPLILSNENTGGLMAFDMMPNLMVTFFVGVMLMPFLTSFGLVEFVGSLIAPVMRVLFKVPGYAAIDALASFLGDGTIGIVVTDEQYQKGYYTQREAAVIATSFSIVGISFAAVVADLLKFSEIFKIFYGTIAFSTVIAGIIITRLPLKKFKDTYYNGKPIVEEKVKSASEAVNLAVLTAKNACVKSIFLDSLFKVLVIYVTFLPVIMFVGTLGLIVAEYTSLFSIISKPLVPLLNNLGFVKQVSEEMAPAMIVGYTDMYLPALLIKQTTSEAARFIVGTMSFAQLIFLSETGLILVNSKIGFNFFDTIKFFILRTVITFPVIYIITMLLVRNGILSM